MINKEKLKEIVIEAETGNEESLAVVREVLRPLKTDTVDQIMEKQHLFIRLIFINSLTYADSPDHKKIDRAYAEQILSYLNTGRPKYKGMAFIGYRESAKTSRVKFNECYLTLYLEGIIDFTTVVSEDGTNADQFNMDMFNTLAFSRISQYYPNIISLEQKKKKSK